MSTWFVTIQAIVRFLGQARKAKQEIDEANEQMSRAAQALCEKWQGEASAAFAQEQGVLYKHCASLGSVGAEYLDLLQKDADRYEEAERRATAAIKG